MEEKDTKSDQKRRYSKRKSQDLSKKPVKKDDRKESERILARMEEIDDIEDDDSDISFSDEDVVEEKHRKKSWSARTKTGLGNSAVGKALFNKFVDKETKKLINTLMVLVEKDQSKKIAKKVKAEIFRIAVKIIVLHEEKYVTPEDFGRLRNNFRRICSATRNGYRTGQIESETANRISELISSFANGIKEIVGKLVSPSTIERIESLVTNLGNAEFIVRVSKLKEFDTVAYVLAYYLQET